MTDMYSYAGREQEERDSPCLLRDKYRFAAAIHSHTPAAGHAHSFGRVFAFAFHSSPKARYTYAAHTLRPSAPRHQYDVTAAPLCWKALLWVGVERELEILVRTQQFVTKRQTCLTRVKNSGEGYEDIFASFTSGWTHSSALFLYTGQRQYQSVYCQ